MSLLPGMYNGQGHSFIHSFTRHIFNVFPLLARLRPASTDAPPSKLNVLLVEVTAVPKARRPDGERQRILGSCSILRTSKTG